MTDPRPRLPGSVWVRCNELAHVTGRSLLPGCRVDMVVLPGFDAGTEGPVLSRLTPTEAYRALSEHVEPTPPSATPTWLPGSRPGSPTAVPCCCGDFRNRPPATA